MEPSTAVRQAEVAAAKTMIERAHDDLDLWPERLIADTGYGSAETLNWLVNDRAIEPHIRCSTSLSAPTTPSRATTLKFADNRVPVRHADTIPRYPTEPFGRRSGNGRIGAGPGNSTIGAGGRLSSVGAAFDKSSHRG